MKCPKRVPLQTGKCLYHKPLFFLSFCLYRDVSFVADGLMVHYLYLHSGRNKSGSLTMLPPSKALCTAIAVPKGCGGTEGWFEKWHCHHSTPLKCLEGLFGGSFLQVSAAAIAVLEIYRFEQALGPRALKREKCYPLLAPQILTSFPLPHGSVWFFSDPPSRLKGSDLASISPHPSLPLALSDEPRLGRARVWGEALQQCCLFLPV